MKVSVIITTYNSPDALGRVLEGLAAQTRLADEVVIADDGSGEETAALIRDYSGTAPFPLTHAWQEDLGFRAARIRNEATKRTTGDYLIIMDGDCIPGRHFIKDHMALAEKKCFVQGKRVLVGKKASENFSVNDANSTLGLIGLTLKGQLSNAHHILHLPAAPASHNKKMRGIRSCNMGIFRQDMLAVNGFNEAFTGWGREDSEFAARLFNYGLKRKEHPFMAICFHLWHQEQSRTSLDKNDNLLQKTINEGTYYCNDGIVKN